MLHCKADFIAQDAEARTYTFRASSAAIDRQNEVIDQAGWDLASYRANPVILDSHKYGSIDDILGKAVRVEGVNGALEVDIQFADTTRGQMAQRLVDNGFLRAVSVGFRSMARRPGAAGEPVTHTRMELLEVSMVAIPANREAVRLRGVEGDDVTEEIKAGRKLSKSTEDKIRAAMALLAELLGEVMQPDMPDGGGDMPANGAGDIQSDMCGPKKPKAAIDEDMHKPGQEPKHKPRKFEVPGDVAAKLAAFAREANTNG